MDKKFSGVSKPQLPAGGLFKVKKRVKEMWKCWSGGNMVREIAEGSILEMSFDRLLLSNAILYSSVQQDCPWKRNIEFIHSIYLQVYWMYKHTIDLMDEKGNVCKKFKWVEIWHSVTVHQNARDIHHNFMKPTPATFMRLWYINWSTLFASEFQTNAKSILNI